MKTTIIRNLQLNQGQNAGEYNFSWDRIQGIDSWSVTGSIFDAAGVELTNPTPYRIVDLQTNEVTLVKKDLLPRFKDKSIALVVRGYSNASGQPVMVAVTDNADPYYVEVGDASGELTLTASNLVPGTTPPLQHKVPTPPRRQENQQRQNQRPTPVVVPVWKSCLKSGWTWGILAALIALALCSYFIPQVWSAGKTAAAEAKAKAEAEQKAAPEDEIPDEPEDSDLTEDKPSDGSALKGPLDVSGKGSKTNAEAKAKPSATPTPSEKKDDRKRMNSLQIEKAAEEKARAAQALAKGRGAMPNISVGDGKIDLTPPAAGTLHIDYSTRNDYGPRVVVMNVNVGEGGVALAPGMEGGRLTEGVEYGLGLAKQVAPQPVFPEGFTFDRTIEIPKHIGPCGKVMKKGEVELGAAMPDTVTLPAGKGWKFNVKEGWHIVFVETEGLEIAIDGKLVTPENRDEKRKGREWAIRSLDENEEVALNILVVKD